MILAMLLLQFNPGAGGTEACDWGFYSSSYDIKMD